MKYRITPEDIRRWICDQERCRGHHLQQRAESPIKDCGEDILVDPDEEYVGSVGLPPSI